MPRPPSTRRQLIAGAAGLAATLALPRAFAQARVPLTYSDTVTEQDPRATILRDVFGKALGAEFEFKPYFGATLFKQGTEPVAMQRGNLDMANLAAFDVQKQIPAWSITTTPYLFRDLAHMKKVFASDVGRELFKMMEDQMGIKVLAVPYIGTRNLGLKPKKKIMTPADLAGIKLRMPPGDAWQLLGRSLGANPTPMAYAETYTGLQTGAIDGQDNPLPNVQNMKFYEVMQQIVLTSHLVGFDVLSMNLKAWTAMGGKQKAFQAAVDKAVAWSAAEHLKREAELAEGFKRQGLDVYVPDVAAFRAHAQKVYLASDEAKAWPKGMLDKINAMK